MDEAHVTPPIEEVKDEGFPIQFPEEQTEETEEQIKEPSEEGTEEDSEENPVGDQQLVPIYQYGPDPQTVAVEDLSINKAGDLIAHMTNSRRKLIGKVLAPSLKSAKLMHSGKLLLKLSNNDNLIVGPITAKDGRDGQDGTGFVWQGKYQYNVTYYGVDDNPDGPLADVVQFDGSSYVCLAKTKAPPPGGNWDLLAAKGESGSAPTVYLGGGGGGSGGPPADLSAYALLDGSDPFTGPITIPNGTEPDHAVTLDQLEDAVISGGGVPPATTVPLAPTPTGATGTATKYAREDHAHPEQAVPAPSSSNPLAAGAAAPGSATTFARADHVHPAQTVPTATNTAPVNPGATSVVGVSNEFARSDHRHQQQDLTPYVKADATVPFTQPITVPDGTSAGKAVNKGQLDAAISGVSAPAAANTNPLVAGTAAPGSAVTYSRADHVHPAQTVPAANSNVPAAPTVSGNAGSATTYARGDHAHPQQDLSPFVKSDGTVDFTGQITVPNGTSGSKAVNKSQLDGVQGVANDAGATASLALSNAASAQIAADAAMPKTGGTFTGPIVVPTATLDGQAVTKQQLDNATGTKVAYHNEDAVPAQKLRIMTETAYGALTPKDPNTVYYVLPG